MPLYNGRTNNLHDTGCFLQVVIYPPQPIVEQYFNNNQPVPHFVATALIDTGATNSCISQPIVDALTLLPFDLLPVLTAQGQAMQLFYDVGLSFPVPNAPVFGLQTPCADLSGQPHQILLGRDVLASCSFNYNGPDNSFTLAF